VKWILIVYITADLWIGTYAYDTQKKCEEALAQWEFQPGSHGACLEAVIEKKRKRK